jgi:DNA-binding MarR family transcriptional regulator
VRQDALDQGKDPVDVIVEQWRRERPDLDPSAKHVTGRVVRLGGLFQDAYARAFAPLGLNDGDYGVLATLRRAGDPFRLTPTDLARQRMMTSGGMTAAIDRLERKGLLRRLPNPADRRGSLVELSDDGRRVVDDAMARHAETEHGLVAALTTPERGQLERLLRKLLLSVEQAG